jgi:geranylgeranyl diphosphate synthase type II
MPPRALATVGLPRIAEDIAPESAPPESAPLSFGPGYRAKHQGDEKLLVEYTRKRRAAINVALRNFLRWDASRPQVLPQAMNYAVLGNGRRLRPILCGVGAEICGGKLEDVMPTACALELIHVYSLVHDDLPALENDDMLRGQPSCHLKFGEAVAILAGDALFAKAFGLLIEQRRISKPKRVLEVLEVITQAVGLDGLTGGQVDNIVAERQPGDLATLEYVHSRKSGALIRASLVAGAVLAGGSAEDVWKLGLFGEAIGHAFQIVDDILAESDPQSQGESVTRGRLTYPSLMGLERSQEIARQKLDEALCELRGFGPAADPLRWIATYVLARSR